MAGSGYKLFATGDILTAAQVNNYLMQQTVMVFANSAARTTALASVLAEGMTSYLQDTDSFEVYNGSAWISASGDLTALTAGDGITITSPSGPVPTVSFDQANYGGGQGAAGKNAVINGAMDIWQRGTSFTTTGTFATSYTADRWQGYQGGAGNTMVTSRQTSDLPGFRYNARVQRPSGSTSTAYLGYWQTIETANSIPYAGKAVTLSFYARAGSNMTNSNALVATINSGTGTDEPNYAFTGYATVATSTVNLVSTGGIINGWTRYTLTGTVASTAKELGVTFTYTPSGTASTNDYYEITGVQLELGSTATPFQRAAGNIQGELAACQRYYYRQGGLAAYQAMSDYGSASSTTTAYFNVAAPVTMRTIPTAIDYSTLEVSDQVNAGVAVTGVAFTPTVTSTTQLAIYISVASGLTQYRNYYLRGSNSTSAYLGFTAEL